MNHDFIVLAGTANPTLAAGVARELGAALGACRVERFPDGELSVRLGDVRDRPCLIIDDMISTGGTVVESVRALRAAGARPEFFVAATHGRMLGTACTRFAKEGVGRVFHTDSVTPQAAQ